MKKLLKVFSGLTLTSLFLVGSAFATTQQFSFSFFPGESQYTSNHAKDDNEQKAYVTTTGGNLTSSKGVWFRVENSSNTVRTEVKKVTSSQRNTLNYLQPAPRGGQYRLKAQGDSSAVNVRGYWTP